MEKRAMRESWVDSGVWARCGVLGLVVIAMAGCSGIRVSTDFDRSISFENFQRYAWLEPPKVEGASPFADNSLLRKRLRTAVETHMAVRGFRLVENPEDADFLVTYSVDLSDRIRDDGSVSVGVGGYRHYGYGGLYTSGGIRNYQESTLIIDIVDPAAENLLWRGWASGVLGTRDRNRSDERIDAGVKRILDRFPPDPPDPEEP
jgi:Domain of unknown function (DUF4136)